MTETKHALNADSLTALKSKISVPSYDRSKLTSSIVHIGVGNFHRAHQAYYMHQLFGRGEALSWAITGVGLRESDRKNYDALTAQDGLYSLIIQSAEGDIECEIIGSIQSMLLSIENPKTVISRLSDPDTKIISMTITEGGYNFDPHTGAFDFENEDVKHDLKNPDQPVSFFGYITAGLAARRDQKAGPITILSCDNVQHNGDVAKRVILDFAKKQRPDLLDWIEENVTFPNSMVDRITPRTSEANKAYLEKTFGFQDAAPVNCEPFLQWVIEDNFAAGRPPLENVGAQFVEDVAPYEEIKLRILNAGHSIVGLTGAIHGYETIDQCVDDKVLRGLLRSFLQNEAAPQLSPVEGIDIETYIESTITRFGNPNIKDSVTRICSESSSKLPKFLLPTLRENLNSGGPIKLASLVIAAWCYYSAQHEDQNGKPLEIIDVMSEQLHEAAKAAKDNPAAFLDIETIFGDLKTQDDFVEYYSEYLNRLYDGERILDIISSL